MLGKPLGSPFKNIKIWNFQKNNLANLETPENKYKNLEFPDFGAIMAKVKGFKANQANIAKKEGVSSKAAGAILAASTRKASPAAKAKNPKLKKVK